MTIAIPKGTFAEPKNNFSEGYATVSSSTKKGTEAACFAKPDGATGEYADVNNGDDMMTKRIDATGAAAGNLYDSRVYRTLYAGTCYEVALTVHTTNIGNYEPGTVAEFDKEEAFKLLEDIRNTFVLRTEEGPLK